MRIRVADRQSGECIINSRNELSKEREYAIKSLCMLQLMCMNSENDENFREFLRILREAVSKLDRVFGGKNDIDPFEQFNSSVV